ncbi:MAG: glycoside hydrolase family 3 N-terminal domain-containing protein [Acidobacteriota bacterium]
MKKSLVLFVLIGLFAPQYLFAQTPRNDKQSAQWVEKALKELSLREKIGQMINVPFNTEFTNFNSDRFARIRWQIEQNKVGGFTVFRGEANAIAALTNEAQRLSKIPLFFSADYERGLRMQSRTGTSFTTNMGVAAAGDPQAAYRQGKIICDEMRAIGVNWLFGPVADINNNPDNPVINIRSYGADPTSVGEFVTALSRGVKERGCLATLKHFPGHGDTATDSHIGLSVVPIDRKRLDAVELVPFKMAINGGVDSVMTAHVAVPNVTGDNLPGTLSPKISTDILRGDLKFDGIITTDSMEMGAITKNYPNGQSAVMAIKAGADVVLFPPDPEKAINAIEEAVKKGEITEERINQSVRRLLAAKYRIGLVQDRFVDLSQVNHKIEQPENVKEANATAERSITLLRNGDNFFPLPAGKADSALFVVIAADDDAMEGSVLIPEIQRRAPRAKVIRLDPRSTPDEYRKVLSDAAAYSTIVIAPFVKRAALKGTVALPENQADFVKQLLNTGKSVGVVAFGSPYLIRQFRDVKTYVVTYAIEDVAQFAAARAIFGEVPFSGRLPVAVPGLFEIGAGVAK